MEKTEWPSPEYLNDLRDEGIVPYSQVCSRALVLSGMAACIYLSTEIWLEFIHGWELLLEQQMLTRNLLDSAVLLILMPAAVTLVTVLLSIVLQTKFLWKFERMTLDLSRLNPFRSLELKKKLWATLSKAFLMSAILFAGVVFYLLCSRKILELSHFLRSSEDLAVALRLVVEEAAFIAIIGGVVLAGIAWLFEQWHFRQRNRMPKEPY